MHRFNYTMNHREDEKYMTKMCHEGWAATKLIEGFWTFEPCKPDEYIYRVAYLRGKDKEEVEQLKNQLKEKNIEFVSRYSFWAIFRSTEEFHLYNRNEEKAIIAKIVKPMLPGAIISWIACILFLILGIKISKFFLILTCLTGIYAFICTCLKISYTQLYRTL